MKYRILIVSAAWACLGLVAFVSACSTLPSVKHDKYQFPKGFAFVGNVKRPYQVLGLVRAKEDYESMDPGSETIEEGISEGKTLCTNYYNKAVNSLVEAARRKGADAVIDVKSVVFLEDGRKEEYQTPECADDGMEGQILTQGIAVKWKAASSG